MEVFDPSGPEIDTSNTTDSETRRLAPVASTNPIRLLLVDERQLLRDGLRALVAEQSGFDVVGQAGTLAAARALDMPSPTSS